LKISAPTLLRADFLFLLNTSVWSLSKLFFSFFQIEQKKLKKEKEGYADNTSTDNAGFDSHPSAILLEIDGKPLFTLKFRPLLGTEPVGITN
jgi:hypothetical protein